MKLTISAMAGSNVTMPYAEIGAILQQEPFWSIDVGGLFLLFAFEFRCTQNIVSG